MVTNYLGAAAGLGLLLFANSKKGKETIKSDKVRLAVNIVGAVTSIYFSYKEAKNINQYLKNLKYKKELTTANNPTGTGTTIDTDTGQPQQVDLKTVAAKIHDAFYNNDWFGWTEDETEAAKALNEITTADASRLAEIYFQLYGKILKEDFIEFLSPEEVNGIMGYLNAM